MHPSGFPLLLPTLLASILLHESLVAGGCLTMEREALLGFRNGIKDASHRLSSWRGRDCCGWAGVVCDASTGHVVKLNLRNTHAGYDWSLRGQINSSLLALTELKYLDLSGNDFRGSRLPEFIGSFRKLRYLNLSWASFTGAGIPPHLGNLSELRYLDLSGAVDSYYNGRQINSLDWLPRLSSLKYLDLCYLRLQGDSDWLRSVNMLPSLRELHMQGCFLRCIMVSSVPINITSLETLNLSYNVFVNSTLPEWLWSIAGLKSLDLSFCKLHGTLPHAIGNLTSLTTLDLSFNNYGEVTLLRSIANLPRLQRLILMANKMAGNFPNWLQQMTSLNSLDLRVNSLSSSVPSWIGRLANLTELYLGFNSFQGTISEAHFENLTRLQVLDLYKNSLAVSLGQGWIPPFQLRLIRLGGCRLGPRFPQWIQSQRRIRKLDLSECKIEDALPEWFSNISSTTIVSLDLSSNRIGGSLPPALPSMLQTVYLHNNSFTGPLPTWPHVAYFQVSHNSLEGGIPSSICTSSVLEFLDLSSNNLSGKIPHCSGESLKSLSILILANNNFSGNIPSSIGSLQQLRELQLNNNSLAGEIPSALKNCTKLLLLDLGQNRLCGSVPSWLGELTQLRFLRLHSNKFSGEIPWQLSKLHHLTILDVSGNIIIGRIPHSVGNFTGMASKSHIKFLNETVVSGLQVQMKGEELFYGSYNIFLVKSLDLSSNNLTGEIPKEIGALVELKNLNLSNNRLSGKIPGQIGHMKSLESLDLSMNDLSGNIPEALSALTFMSHLNLSYNNLTGVIPASNQVRTLDNTPYIYIGNPGLCTPDESNNCLCRNGTILQNGDEEYTESSEMIWICASTVLGFAVGFWSFSGVLIFKGAWRYSYFHTVDNFFERLSAKWKLSVLQLRRVKSSLTRCF